MSASWPQKTLGVHADHVLASAEHSMAVPPQPVTTKKHRLATPCPEHKKTMAQGFDWMH